MALSGTLDTFALPDVFRLLSSTAKTGRLRVTGDRGSGSVWFDEGRVAATEVTGPGVHDEGPVEAIFSLLRFSAGSFTFEGEARAPHAGPPVDLEPILAEAENLLVEWQSIEAVVPGLDSWVSLEPRLGGGDVMIDASRWSVIAAVGSGRTVGEIGAELELGELAVSRLVKELVELGLVAVGERPVAAPVADLADAALDAPVPVADADVAPPPAGAPVPVADADVAPPPAGGPAPVADLPAEPDTAPGPEPVTVGPDPATGDPGTVSAHRPVQPSLASLETSDAGTDPLLPAGDPLERLRGSDDGPRVGAVDDASGSTGHATGGLFAGASSAEAEASGDLDPAEMARQLANLSPKAAKAVARAARASTQAERDEALAQVEAEAGDIDRGMLLRFLGSVDL